MATQNIYSMVDTWNSAGTTFTGIGLSVTDTASASGSLLLDLQVGGVSRFKVNKDGYAAAARYLDTTGTYGIIPDFGSSMFVDVNGALIVRGSAPSGEYLRVVDGALTIKTDLTLARDAANTLAQRNGTNAQTFRVYNTYTDASNYERGGLSWAANALYLFSNDRAGTGALRSLVLASGSNLDFLAGNNATAQWRVNVQGHFVSGTDNTYDIGAPSATRPRNLYVATDIVAGNNVRAVNIQVGNTNSYLNSPSSGVVGIYNSAGTDFGRLQFGGTTSSFPSLKRNGTAINVRLADDSADAPFTSGRATINTLTVGLGGQTAVSTNTALGFEALNSASVTGTGNLGVGYQALKFHTTGENNTAVGLYALYSNTTANGNTAIGRSALENTTTGLLNTAIGQQALLKFVASNGQVAIGFRALWGGDATPANNTGSNNIAIGYQAGDAITTGSTNLVIGYDIDVDSATASNQINIADRYFHDRIRLLERTSDPAKPAEGNMVVWLSDGTGLGDDGDVIISSTAGGVTKYAILFDHSAGTLWP